MFAAIRDAVGPDYIVGIRMTGDEHVGGGRDPDECVEIARILAASGLVDFFNVVAGTLGTDNDVAYTIPNMDIRRAPFSGWRGACGPRPGCRCSRRRGYPICRRRGGRWTRAWWTWSA